MVILGVGMAGRKNRPACPHFRSPARACAVRDQRETVSAISVKRCPRSREMGVRDRVKYANQVYYSLSERGPEFSLLPLMRERQMPLMAYSPIDQGALIADATLAAIARPRGLTAAQVALAWISSQPGVLAIPKAGTLQHLQENLAAGSIELDACERQAIEARFPPPRRKTPLAMI